MNVQQYDYHDLNDLRFPTSLGKNVFLSRKVQASEV